MIALVAQAFETARKADIDWRNLYDVMLNGSGNSGVLRKMVAPALEGDFEGYRFSLANAAKDIGYFKALATGLGHGNYIGWVPWKTYSRLRWPRGMARRT